MFLGWIDGHMARLVCTYGYIRSVLEHNFKFQIKLNNPNPLIQASAEAQVLAILGLAQVLDETEQEQS